MRIGIDVMGGDHAPDAILAGAVEGLALLGDNDQLVLIGDAAVIEDTLDECSISKADRAKIEIVATTQTIGMGDSPVEALRNKPDSSIVKMAALGGRRADPEAFCDVVFSAGNTGACVAAAQMSMRRLKGVHRPGIAVTFPTFHGPVVLCDAGANPEPRPSHLHQYGVMASTYAAKLHGIDNPRVALLSIGGEEGKGNTLVKETHALLKCDDTINYIGYGEGRDIFAGKADVYITEGFTGNVVLKLAEGLASGLFTTIAHEIFAYDAELAMKLEPVVTQIKKNHDYHEYGAAPLLGTNGNMMILHGSSEARTVRAAIRSCIEYHKDHVKDEIIEAVARSTAALARHTEAATETVSEAVTEGAN